MLEELDLIAVLPAKDMNRAKEFYRGKLGLEPSEVLDDENLVYSCGNGTTFLLYKTENAGTAKNTQMGWASDNIGQDVDDLRGRGIVFEEYDFPDLKTENGIATTNAGKAAWFRDTEGNILNIFQRK